MFRFAGRVKLGLLCLTLLSGGQESQAQSTVATDTVGTYPSGIAVNPATNTIYITNHDSNTVSVINGATNAVTTLTSGQFPSAVASNPVTTMAYSVNYNNPSGLSASKR